MTVKFRNSQCIRGAMLNPMKRNVEVLVPSSTVSVAEEGLKTTPSTADSALTTLDKAKNVPFAIDETPESEKPGFLDRDYFRFDDSAEFWLDFKPGEYEPADLIAKIQDSVTNSRHATYWAYHLGRFGFFVASGVLGVLYAQNQGNSPPQFTSQILATRNGGYLKNIPNDVIETHLWNLKWIKDGKFRMPYDMNPRHRQFDPRYLATTTWKAVNEMSNILKKRNNPDEANTDVWVDNKIYPDYYRKTFHFQTDGWLSSRSADIYDHMTEIIFNGKQDAMQRTTLVPFSKFMDETNEEKPKVLEIAAGTGRFATFVKDSFPEIDLTVSELSPYYLEKARETMRYWEENFSRSETPPTRFVQAAGEDIPVSDASQDCVMSVYLFHELPPEARRAVIREVARVLKPGGTFILTDSVQLGDRRVLDPTLGNFEKLNEPWYPSYIKENFGEMLTETGLFKAEEKYVNSATKTLSFTRL